MRPEGVVFEITGQMCGKLLNIALGGEQPGDAVQHGLRNTAVAEADHRDAHGLSFREDVAEGFAHTTLDGDAGTTKDASPLQPSPDHLLRKLAEKRRPDAKFPIQLLE
jgi:hypothetical protein